MFDANMRHLPVGHKGFARVGSVKEGGLWERLGIVKGSLVHMTTNKSGNWDDHEEDLKANVTVHLESGDINVTSYGEDKYYSRMVYEGTLNKDNVLTGFIHLKSLNEAIEILNKSKTKHTVGKNHNVFPQK